MCEIMDGIRNEGIKIGERRGKILGTVELMRELEYLDVAIENKLVEKYHISQEKARAYVAR
ncbi:MAG: hypothetical protein R3Y58_02220 [Eubacteriales bacterium]